MSLINKMLQDLDKRHAADSGGKTMTQQLRPVQARKHWQRIVWEIGAGLIVGGGWALWVTYQISPRSVVTELAFQSQARRVQAAGAREVPVGSPAQQVPVAPVAVVPPQTAEPPIAAAATASAPPAAAVSAVSVTRSAESASVDSLKLATEIATPFVEKSTGAKAKAERKRAVETATATAAQPGETPASIPVAPKPGGQPAAKARSHPSIEKQVLVLAPAERAENEFRKATALLNQGRVAEAIDGYRSTLQQDAGHAAARQALIGLLLENRRIDEAQPFLQEGLTLNPARSDYAMLLARIQVERGDLQGAHELLGEHAGGAANNAEYHAFDAALLQRLGRHKEAVAGYQSALRLSPRAGLWWMGMGISMQAENRGAEALDAFRRAKAAGSLSPDLLAFVDQRIKQLQ